jgi:hypothetical protein
MGVVSTDHCIFIEREDMNISFTPGIQSVGPSAPRGGAQYVRLGDGPALHPGSNEATRAAGPAPTVPHRWNFLASPQDKLNRRLMTAARSGNGAEIQARVHEGADARTIGHDGRPVIKEAIRHLPTNTPEQQQAAAETLRVLVGGGADPRVETQSFRRVPSTAIESAQRHGWLDPSKPQLVQVMHELGARQHLQDRAAVHAARARESNDRVRRGMADAGFSPARPPNRRT